MIHQHIQRLRKEKGMTQKKLGEIVYLSGQTITQYEKGTRQVTAEMMEYLLEALDAKFKIQFEDRDLQVKATSNDFFEEWAHMDKVFSQWKVLHTGGHIYVLEREFISKQGVPILVHLTDECIIIFKNIDEHAKGNTFASKDIYDKHIETYEGDPYNYETILADYNQEKNQLESLPLAEELFNEESLALMLLASKRYCTARSERHVGVGIQQYIKKLRLAKKWSQEDLADAMHFTPQCISQYESGTRNVSADTLEAIMQVLGAKLTVV